MNRQPASESVRRAFVHHRDLRPVLDAVLEGRLGQVHRAGAGDAFRLDAGCYSFFGGAGIDPGAEGLVRTTPAPRELVLGGSEPWAQLVARVFRERITPRPMQGFRWNGLDRSRLESFAATLPGGYSLQDIDAPLAGRLAREVEPHALQSYDGVDHSGRNARLSGRPDGPYRVSGWRRRLTDLAGLSRSGCMTATA